MSDDEAALWEKVGALEIILTSPLWPERQILTPSAQALYDPMVTDAKQFCLFVVRRAVPEALTILGNWAALLHRMMDDPEAVDTPGRDMMAAVFKHYADAVGIDWSKIQFGATAS